MADKIGGSWRDLADDAFSNTTKNFQKSIEVIDEAFGKDYAKKHPDLVGAFLQASATEMSGIIIGVCIQELQNPLRR
jgi:hypothetical protein